MRRFGIGRRPGFRGIGGSVAAAAPAWTPASIAGLKAWLRGDAGVTGNPVSAQADQTAVGTNFTQGTVTNQPGVRTVNGRAAVDYDGNDNYLECANALSTVINAAGSIWHVQCAFVADAINTTGVIGAAANNDCILGNTPGYWGLSLANIAGVYEAQCWQFDAGYNGVALPGVTLGSVMIVDWWADGITINARLNAGATVTDPIIGTIPAPGRLGPIKQGVNFGNTAWFDGAILEWYAINAVLSGADQAAGRTYLANRWGGTV